MEQHMHILCGMRACLRRVLLHAVRVRSIARLAIKGYCIGEMADSSHFITKCPPPPPSFMQQPYTLQSLRTVVVYTTWQVIYFVLERHVRPAALASRLLLTRRGDAGSFSPSSLPSCYTGQKAKSRNGRLVPASPTPLEVGAPPKGTAGCVLAGDRAKESGLATATVPPSRPFVNACVRCPCPQ